MPDKQKDEYVPRWMVEGQATARALSEEITRTARPGEALPSFVEEFIKESKKPDPLFGMTTPSLDISTPSLDLKYDGGPLPLQDHLIELWGRLRKVAKVVFLMTLFIMVIPGLNEEGDLAIDPYSPAVLALLNNIISYGLDSLREGGDVTVYIGTPIAPITLYINLAISIAILLSLPLTVHELYEYIRPGLTEKEDQVLKQIFAASIVLFVMGAVISFTTIIPVTLRILSLASTFVDGVQPWFDLQAVLNILIWGTVGAGILYMSPMVLVALVQLDLLPAEEIYTRRREMIFGVFFLAAIVTPDPTLVSMVILSLPMLIVIEGVVYWTLKIEGKRYLDQYGKITLNV